MPKTLREGLQQFLRDLRAYAELPQPVNSDPAVQVAEDARRDTCEAHAVHVERLLGLPDTDVLHLRVTPDELCVWVILPTTSNYGDATAIKLADGVDVDRPPISSRNKALIRTLLAVAQNETNGHGQSVPVLPPHGAPASYQAPPPAPWTWGL